MNLNQDLWIEIFKYLSLKEKLKCAIVCKEWYQLQKYIYKNQTIKISKKLFESKNFRTWFNKNKCIINFDFKVEYHDLPNDMKEWICKISFIDIYNIFIILSFYFFYCIFFR